jgi:hypothetical protein
VWRHRQRQATRLIRSRRLTGSARNLISTRAEFSTLWTRYVPKLKFYRKMSRPRMCPTLKKFIFWSWCCKTINKDFARVWRFNVTEKFRFYNGRIFEKNLVTFYYLWGVIYSLWLNYKECGDGIHVIKRIHTLLTKLETWIVFQTWHLVLSARASRGFESTLGTCFVQKLGFGGDQFSGHVKIKKKLTWDGFYDIST